MYEEHVLSHYQDPYHKATSPIGPTHTLNSVGDVCGDEVTIELRLDDDRIAEIWWTGEGCCFSQAAASMVCEHFHGKMLDDVRHFDQDDMMDLFRAEVSNSRLGCVLVAYNALKEILK
jgi:nitrogen fixation NifU-like protein